jgi:hypothetical protein
MDLDVLVETRSGKEYGPDRRIIHLGLAGLPVHSESDFMVNLGGEFVKRKSRNKADDTVRHKLGYVDKIDFRRKALHFGQLIKTPRSGNQRTLIAEAVDGAPVNPSTQWFLGTDNPSLLPDNIYSFFSGGIHVKGRYNNVGNMSVLPTLFDQMMIMQPIRNKDFMPIASVISNRSNRCGD